MLLVNSQIKVNAWVTIYFWLSLSVSFKSYKFVVNMAFNFGWTVPLTLDLFNYFVKNTSM